jgi:DNA-directed RNA polymerase subunit beta'
VTQDVIVLDDDCGTHNGIWIIDPEEKGLLTSLTDRITGRLAASQITNSEDGEIIAERDEVIDEVKAGQIVEGGIKSVYVRSPLSCQSRRGICQKCYGRDLARGHIIDFNTAVGIIAAQSIGEPGTQLTLRTFHTGGVVGLDITSGLPRVEELFEARAPKAEPIISEIDGGIELIIEAEGGRRIIVSATQQLSDDHKLPLGFEFCVKNKQMVEVGEVLAIPSEKKELVEKEKVVAATDEVILARAAGIVSIRGKKISIKYTETEEREYIIPAASHIRVRDGDCVKAGEQLTDGSINPQEILRVLGQEAVQRYLVEEVQKVYCSQGVHINDKHIEVIVRQMLSRVRVDSSGDTRLVHGELIGRFLYEDENARVVAEGGQPATAHPVILGITRASLSTSSWLAAASFQETTRVLTEAAIFGKVDKLVGLKENVIIGKLIPAQCTACKEAVEEKAVELELAASEQPDEITI